MRGRGRQQRAEDGHALGHIGRAAAKTNQPPDYERRIVVMQAYLRNERSAQSSATLRTVARTGIQVQVELRRQLCTKDVPFTVISCRTAPGW